MRRLPLCQARRSDAHALLLPSVLAVTPFAIALELEHGGDAPGPLPVDHVRLPAEEAEAVIEEPPEPSLTSEPP